MPTTLRLRAGDGPGAVLTHEAARRLATSSHHTLSLKFHEGDQLTPDLPRVTRDETAHLDDDGLARVGQEVRPGLILVGRLAVTPPQEPDSPEAALDAAFGVPEGRDGSLRCPPGLSGRVESIARVIEGEGRDAVPAVSVTIVTDHPLAIGEVLELDSARAAVVSGWTETLEGDDALWPGVSGALPVAVRGPLATAVLHARSIGPYSQVTQQPLGGREAFGGQAVLRSELQALLDRGAPHMVHELLTVKSDDVAGRFSLYESIVLGKPACRPTMPFATRAIERCLLALGFEVDLSEPEVALKLATDAAVVRLAPGVVKKPETLNYRTFKPERDGLFCEEIFGALGSPERTTWLGHLELAVPLLHPWARDLAARLLGWTAEHLESVLRCETLLEGEQTGAPAVHAALAAVDLDHARPDAQADAAAMKRNRLRPEGLCFTRWPVLPPEMRPLVPLEGGRFATSDLNDLYRRLINRNNRTRRLLELAAPEIILRNEIRMLQASLDGVVENDVAGRQTTGPNGRVLVSLSDYLAGKHGQFTRAGSKRVDYSGVARIAPLAGLAGATARIPRVMALELLKPWLYAHLEERGHVSRIKEARRLVDQRDPVALAALDAVIGTVPFVLFNEKTPAQPTVVSVTATLWDEPALGLSPEVVQALGATVGDNAVVHVPIDPRAVEEARALTVDRTPQPARAQVEGWLAKAARLERPGPLLMHAALYGQTDPVRDRFSRMLLARLDPG